MIWNIILLLLERLKLRVSRKKFGMVTINGEHYTKSKIFAKTSYRDYDVLICNIKTIIRLLPEDDNAFFIERKSHEKEGKVEYYIGYRGLHYITTYMAIEDSKYVDIDDKILRIALLETYRHLEKCRRLQEELDKRKKVWKHTLCKY